MVVSYINGNGWMLLRDLLNPALNCALLYLGKAHLGIPDGT